FLRQHTSITVLRDANGAGVVAVAPAWQGRVMTSSAQGEEGASFGWINRKLIASGETLPQFNPLGGEDRLWLGPQGGQVSVYFAQGAPFDLEHWYVPRGIDTLPFEVTEQAADHVVLKSAFELTNYSGTKFQVRLDRTVRLLRSSEAWKRLSVSERTGLSLV